MILVLAFIISEAEAALYYTPQITRTKEKILERSHKILGRQCTHYQCHPSCSPLKKWGGH